MNKKIIKKVVNKEEFTHEMRVKKVIIYNNNIAREKREAEEEANYILFIGRPLVYLYTREITTPYRNDLHVYGVYSIKPDKQGNYNFQYSMVLDDEEVEMLKEYEKVVI